MPGGTLGPALPTPFFLTCPRMRIRTDKRPALPTPLFLPCPSMRTSGQILGQRCLFMFPVRAFAQRQILGLRYLCFLFAHAHKDRNEACAAYTIFLTSPHMRTRTDMRPALPMPFCLFCPRMRTRTEMRPAPSTPFFLTSPRMRTKTNIGPALPKHLFF